jgi:hypothetical protein
MMIYPIYYIILSIIIIIIFSAGKPHNEGVASTEKNFTVAGENISEFLSDHGNDKQLDNLFPGLNDDLSNQIPDNQFNELIQSSKEAISQSSLEIITSRQDYIVGSQVSIDIYIDSYIVKYPLVNLLVTPKNSSEIIYNVTRIIPLKTDNISLLYKGSFTFPGLNIHKVGDYKIHAKILNKYDNVESFSFIKVHNLFFVESTYFLYLGIGFLLFFIIVILTQKRNQIGQEIFRFISISGIIISIILFLVLNTQPLGQNSVIGIVQITIPSDDNNIPFLNTDPISTLLKTVSAPKEWVLNVGGVYSVISSSYNGGIQIPMYIIVLGFIGGYLRYLYKTSQIKIFIPSPSSTMILRWDKVPGQDNLKLKEFLENKFSIKLIENFKIISEENKKIIYSDPYTITFIKKENSIIISINDEVVYKLGIKEEDGIIKLFDYKPINYSIFLQSLEDLTLLFLAPLLAVSLWFLLDLSGVTQQNSLALASFSVGLVTNEIIARIISFTKNIIAKDENGNTKQRIEKNNYQYFRSPFLLIGKYPIENQKNVKINNPIVLSFSNPVDEYTVSDDSFYLTKDKSNQKIPSIIRTQNNNRTLILEPEGELEYDDIYNVIVTNDISDINGDQLQSTYKWKFETIKKDNSNKI